MKSTDDKHIDHDLKAYLDGRDGVSAAYRKTAHEEPPAALDQFILRAARNQATPQVERWYSSRSSYALAASLMIAVVAVSLYFAELDEIAVPVEMQQEAVEVIELQRAARESEGEVTTAVEQDAPEAVAAPAPAAFEARQLAPPVPTISAADTAGAPAPATNLTFDNLARAADAPVTVINGPLLESIEAEAAEAQTARQVASTRLEEITVTGSRIVRRDQGDLSYREERETWLAEMRLMSLELDRRLRLTTAGRSAAVLEAQLEEEMELFLMQYPDSDLDAELAE